MSETNGHSSSGTGTAEIPVVRPDDDVVARATTQPRTAAAGVVPASATSTTTGPVPPAPVDPTEAPPAAHSSGPVAQPTAPVTVRPTPRLPRRGPLTVMGPWAPVAGGALGLLLGLITVIVLAGSAHTYQERLGLVLAVVGLGMLGTAGTLLADEVRMMRQSVRDAAVRPGLAETTAGLLQGLTPARLLLLMSGFVLFLATFVSR
ncbi:MAG: hypothetical protein QOJ68_630 [Blastococcus sp.]|jgi:hypothetical protein|nr:hypothetical protein [Blastococcus sp.]